MKRATEERIPTGVIKVMVANLPIMLCELLQGAFEAVPDIKIVLPANDLQHLLNAAEPLPVDVILIGSSKTENSLGAVSILQSLPDAYKTARVVVLTQDHDYAEVISLVSRRREGNLRQRRPSIRAPVQVQSAASIRDRSGQRTSCSPTWCLPCLTQGLRTSSTAKAKPLLTTREQQVLHLLSDGLSNSELAAVLKLSEHTIKNHLFRIYDKLGVSSRMEAVLYALTPRNTHPVQNRPLNPPSSNKITIIKTA